MMDASKPSLSELRKSVSIRLIVFSPRFDETVDPGRCFGALEVTGGGDGVVCPARHPQQAEAIRERSPLIQEPLRVLGVGPPVGAILAHAAQQRRSHEKADRRRPRHQHTYGGTTRENECDDAAFTSNRRTVSLTTSGVTSTQNR
jgi:hypothetical protein